MLVEVDIRETLENTYLSLDSLIWGWRFGFVDEKDIETIYLKECTQIGKRALEELDLINFRDSEELQAFLGQQYKNIEKNEQGYDTYLSDVWAVISLSCILKNTDTTTDYKYEQLNKIYDFFPTREDFDGFWRYRSDDNDAIEYAKCLLDELTKKIKIAAFSNKVGSLAILAKEL
jgi:hypothetical protein